MFLDAIHFQWERVLLASSHSCTADYGRFLARLPWVSCHCSNAEEENITESVRHAWDTSPGWLSNYDFGVGWFHSFSIQFLKKTEVILSPLVLNLSPMPSLLLSGMQGLLVAPKEDLKNFTHMKYSLLGLVWPTDPRSHGALHLILSRWPCGAFPRSDKCRIPS